MPDGTRAAAGSPRRAWRDPLFFGALLLAIPAVPLLAVIGLTPSPLPAEWSARALLLLAVVLVYPLLEETVFRGLLQGALLARGGGYRLRPGLSLANLLVSSVFALAHLAVQGSPYALLVFLPSLVFGAFYERHGGLASPVILHAVYNAAWFGSAWLPWRGCCHIG